MKLVYRRSPFILPTALFGTVVLACIGLIAGNLQQALSWSGAVYILVLSISAGFTGLAAYLTGRFVFRSQHLTIGTSGISATYLNKGNVIPWASIEETSFNLRGIVLGLSPQNRITDLFVRPAIETKGLSVSVDQLHSVVEGARKQHAKSSSVLNQP